MHQIENKLKMCLWCRAHCALRTCLLNTAGHSAHWLRVCRAVLQASFPLAKGIKLWSEDQKNTYQQCTLMQCCVCKWYVLGFSREQPYTRRFITGIGSGNYGGWEVPHLAAWKQENQESWWCNLVQVRRPENHEPSVPEGGSSSKE